MDNITTYLEQARKLCLHGEFSTAYSIYNDLLREHSINLEVLQNYGWAKYCEYVDLEKATQLFEQARVLKPDSVETLLWIGDLYALGYGQGYNAAADAYKQAIQVNPAAVDAYIGLGILHRTPSKPVTLEEAIISFCTATQIDPQRADAYFNLGMALVEAGNLHTASEKLLIAQRLLKLKGEQRQIKGVQQILNLLAGNEPITTSAYWNLSPRYY